ncbi:glycosyltransferase family 2 protein [candidate division WWE3 bacterium]|jgi:dolichol-phosphate mannosyltransferase|uniref:Glycosyltransferase family 2 protein n=1 Tax=candidate division WWE3 bacterium TaxID=2053526 RepID=A0A3A4ZAR2_UNCKA|nr:MAG: glycosyltransferase family 2 protein [candidate division WWE3 bacterium]
MNIVVVMPTYNEAENIGKMIDALEEQFAKFSDHNCILLVVDGNSPDGTAEVVSKKAESKPYTHLLLEEKKTGIGGAYFYGFAYAMSNYDADVLIEMDADFQHDPNDVPRLIAEILNGYDYVIGSRFVKGGGIPKDWAFYRKFLSVGGNIFSKIVLGIYNVNDFTGGFKASRVKGFVDKIDFSTIPSKGFAYKVYLLYQMHKLGAKIKEIPILFGLRDRGNSKIEKSTFFDVLFTVLRIRYESNKSFFKFCIVGFTGLFVDLVLSNIFRLLIPNPSVAASSAALLAMLVTFLLNNVWSFSEKKITETKELISTFFLYAAISLVPIIFRFFFVGFLVKKIAETFIIYNAALFVSILFGLIWNFTFYSRIIWKAKK